VSGFFAAHIYIISENDKTRTQPKRERERESVLRTRVIITPIIAIQTSHIKRKRKICSRLSTQISKFPTPTHFARERRRHPTKTISLSLSDGIFTEGPNVSSS
jgi:hypothetical protein